MSFNWFAFLSGLVCCVLCALLAAACVRAKLRALLDRAPRGESGLSAAADKVAQSAPKNHTQGSRFAVSLASFAALAAFLGIPLGSLPAIFPFSWGGLAVLGCLGLTLGFEENWTWNEATRRNARVLALLGLCLALFAWYARQRGVPGELFSLDSYVATPLAGLMGWQGRLGALLLALALLLAVRDVQQSLASGLARVAAGLEAGEARAVVISAMIRQTWILAVLGMAVCLFVPLCPAGWFGMPGVTGIAADALFFWLKLLIADHTLWLAANKLPGLSAFATRAQFPLAGLGALCMAFA